MKHIVSTQLIYHATSAEVATPAKRYSESLTKRFALSNFPLPVYGEGERGGGSRFADTKLYGYRQNLYAGAKLSV